MTPAKPRCGWLCSYTPVELIIASGFTPVRISGCEEQSSHEGHLLPSNLCPYVKSVLDQALRGQHEDFGAVSIVASCDAMRRLADAWRRAFSGTPLHVIDFPRRTSPEAHRYLLSQYRTFLDWLMDISGMRFSDSDLNQAIDIVNRKRALLRNLSNRRKMDPPGVAGSEFFNEVSRASRLPADEFFGEHTYIDREPLQSGPRLVITGSIIESSRLYEVIETAGAHVVAEDTCTGLRGIEGHVEDGPDPLVSIARRYLSRPPCSRMSDLESRQSYIMKLVREYKAWGVVYHCLKFCDQYQYDYPLLRDRLEAEGVPVLRIETDYQEGDRGQLSTRIEAFLELLSERSLRTP